MNKDQVKGRTKKVIGAVQEKVGKLVGSKKQQAQGLEKQIVGRMQKNVGDAEKYMKDQRKRH